MKRSIWVVLMVMLIPIGFMPTAVAAPPDSETEWTYNNSLVVTVEVDSPRDFVPEDFPGVFCADVIIVSKAPIDSGWQYTLILQLKEEALLGDNDYLIGRYIERAMEIPMVTYAERNHYVSLDGYLHLEDSIRYVPVGCDTQLQVAHRQIYGDSYDDRGIEFTVDTAVFGEDAPTKEMLAEYGVTSIWPYVDSRGEGILLTRPSDLEGTKSEADRYYATIDTDRYSCIEAVDRLANREGILAADIVRWTIMGGQQSFEEWTCSNTDVAEITLTGGKEHTSSITPLDQTAVITAKSPGIAIVSIRQSHSLIELSDSCTIVAYISGDVDGDDAVSASDALTALLAATEKIHLSGRSFHAADIDNSGYINSSDALMILQKATGKIE